MPVEIYAAGVRYDSVIAYHRQKSERRDEARIKKMDALLEDVAFQAEEKKKEHGSDAVLVPLPVSIPPGMRIAGIEPSMTELVESFDTTEPAVVSKDVFSAFELQDCWLEDLKNENGPLLLIADTEKVRLMRLEKKP